MKTTIALLALFFFVLGGGYFLSTRHMESVPPAVVETGNSSTTTSATLTPAEPSPVKTGGNSRATQGGSTADGGTQAPGTYTSAQIATHNASTNCWTSINGSVYDLTRWISEHPGGQGAILSICGKDGTQAFQSQHGNPRDTRPEAILATFKIGTLAP